jgi:hypothetical protein
VQPTAAEKASQYLTPVGGESNAASRGKRKVTCR